MASVGVGVGAVAEVEAPGAIEACATASGEGDADTDTDAAKPLSGGMVIEERFMHGIGKGDARTVSDSPGSNVSASCPSMDTPAGARERCPICNLYRRK